LNEQKTNIRIYLKQQRLSFVAKGLKEFDVANVKKIEAIKQDWNPL